MFPYSTGYYVSPPDDQYLKFKNRCSLIYSIEHHSVCPLVGTGTPPPLQPQVSVPSPPDLRVGGAHSPAAKGVGESQFQRLEKRLALCLLCGQPQTTSLCNPPGTQGDGISSVDQQQKAIKTGFTKLPSQQTTNVYYHRPSPIHCRFLFSIYMKRVFHAWRTRQWSRCSCSSSYSPGSGTSSTPVQKRGNETFRDNSLKPQQNEGVQ